MPLDVLSRLGTVALLRITGAFVLVTLLHLLRLPLVVLAEVIAVSMRRVTAYANQLTESAAACKAGWCAGKEGSLHEPA